MFKWHFDDISSAWLTFGGFHFSLFQPMQMILSARRSLASGADMAAACVNKPGAGTDGRGVNSPELLIKAARGRK